MVRDCDHLTAFLQISLHFYKKTGKEGVNDNNDAEEEAYLINTRRKLQFLQSLRTHISIHEYNCGNSESTALDRCSQHLQ